MCRWTTYCFHTDTDDHVRLEVPMEWTMHDLDEFVMETLLPAITERMASEGMQYDRDREMREAAKEAARKEAASKEAEKTQEAPQTTAT
jgi:hypothetical protein